MDIDGYQRHIFAYVVPGLRDNLILGMPWYKEEDVIVEANKKELHMRYAGIVVDLSSNKERKQQIGTREISATGFMSHHQRISKEEGKTGLAQRVCAISSEEINKALKPKI